MVLSWNDPYTTIYNNDMEHSKNINNIRLILHMRLLTWSMLRELTISDFTHEEIINMEHSKNINNI